MVEVVSKYSKASFASSLMARNCWLCNVLTVAKIAWRAGGGGGVVRQATP